ncbi:MAG: translation initiation factor IF-1 [bacterium]
MDELGSASGGVGASTDVIVADGTVISAVNNGGFTVDIGGQIVTAFMSGKLRMNYIRIKPGDRVRVELRGERGRITYVYRHS